MSVEILECGCGGYLGSTAGAAYQNAEYGQGKRAHNPMVKADTFRCTVCLQERGRPAKQLSKRELKEQREAEKAAKAEKKVK